MCLAYDDSYKSLPEKSSSSSAYPEPYQESTYQPETTYYQDTPQPTTYTAEKVETYQEKSQPTESYYAQLREESQDGQEQGQADNELMAEIDALERKLDILQKDIQDYLAE